MREKGIRPVPEYIQAVKDWPLPTNCTEVLAFLGKITYYRRFIPNFASRARDWTDAIKDDKDMKEEGGKDSKTAPIKVTPEIEKSFVESKEVWTRAPVLAYPRFGEMINSFWILIGPKKMVPLELFYRKCGMGRKE